MTTMDENTTSSGAMLGLLLAPIAVLLAMLTDMIGGFGLGFDNDMMPLLIVAAGAMVGRVPTLLAEQGVLRTSSSSLSLGTIVVGGVLGLIIVETMDGMALTGLLFALNAILTHLLVVGRREEWATVLTFSSIGLLTGLSAAATAGANPLVLAEYYTVDGGQTYPTLSEYREGLTFVFFSVLGMFTALGTLVAVLARGTLLKPGQGWFSHVGVSDKPANLHALPLMLALLTWALAHAATLWQFHSVELADRLDITIADGYHGHFGVWMAALTGLVALVVAGWVAERWYTRSMTLGSMWVLYLIAAANERGMWSNDRFSGSWGPVLWAVITFFLGVIIYSISTHKSWGGWSNRSEDNPSGARTFWQAHGLQAMIGLAFITAFTVRSQWYVIPAMNGYGTGTWDLTGGSDPWYMKRVVDYILMQNAHLVFDADRYYPLGGINPRPPLFVWSIALLSMLIEPFLSTPEDAVWWAMVAIPAIFGALTVFPVAAIARDHVGKGTAVIAAWLIALMPGHISRSTWANADHDAFVMFFMALGFMWFFRAVANGGDERLTRSVTAHPSSVLSAFADVAKQRRLAMASAVLAGIAFGTVALGWKGFVVAPSILFIGYAFIVATNMFRNRDSTILNTLMLTMLGTSLLLSIPFYAYPGMNLVFDGTGLQPLLFVLVFTLALSYVTTGFRDKPWLLVLGAIVGSGAIFFLVLWVLQTLDFSNAFNVLFTGAGYFSKTKIFGTVAEANAPDRGMLFASFGPVVFILALFMGIMALWRGTRRREHTHVMLGAWILLAIFMSWTAARFIFNATPAMAVLGAWGASSLWKRAGVKDIKRKMRRSGIRTPSDRMTSMRKAVWRTPQFSAVLLVLLLLGGQHLTYGLDAGIPSSSSAENEIDKNLYDALPSILRWDQAFGLSVLNPTTYEDGGKRYLGAFGSSFNDQGWNQAYAWLAAQDVSSTYSERPAFVSWWDYGFQALTSGDHPSVSDNFQSGIPATGNMLLARSEMDLTAMFVWQLAEADRMYAVQHGLDTVFTAPFSAVLNDHLTPDQVAELEGFYSATSDDVVANSFHVVTTNRATVLTEGYLLNDDGTVSDDDDDKRWRLWKDGEILPCNSNIITVCDGSDFISKSDASTTFLNNVRVSTDNVTETTHYIFGDYWYTSDLVEEYDSVSTHIHRTNSRLAMSVQLLTNGLDEDGVVDLYSDLISMDGTYSVQDYNGAPGETISRNHEIRYFAVDHRLYPRAGRYTADANYNSGQPMGIFAAPTILSGQDISTFMTEVYETQRGAFSDEMSREEVDEAIRQDVLNQQAGADIDPLQISDVRVDHTAAFFETMVARAYVGYGASSLGMDDSGSNPQPAQHFSSTGSPGSFLAQAYPLPGAMMNHFAIANWYSPGATKNLADANTLVKVLKFYPGAEVTGQVTFADDGQALEGVRLLIERDAFSGEDATDLDADTWWVPIGFVDTDSEGRYSFTAPAGHLRVSAFVGEYEPTAAQADIRDGTAAQMIADVYTEVNTDREVYPVTAILGQVANMTWVGESHINVTGAQADRLVGMTDDLDLEIASSGVSGMVAWSGDDSFAGEPLVDTTFILRNIWSYTDNYSVVTNNGSFSTDEVRILQGTGEVTFDSIGTFESDGVAVARDFTGTYTRTLAANRIHTASGEWSGYGILEDYSSIDGVTDVSNLSDCLENNTVVPENNTICALVDDDGLLFDGVITANGRVRTLAPTTVVREVVAQTFEGAGVFEGIGTLNGTGVFTGSGAFSGPMVQPGSFYKTGLLPGVYNMIAQLPNGREVLLPEPVEVGLVASYDLMMSMPASVFVDNLTMMTGEVLGNTTIELVDVALGEANAVLIVTDENGSFSHGPIPVGDYYYRVDLDNDGWYELNHSITVTDTPETFLLVNPVPPMFDMTIQLSAPLDENGTSVVNLAGRNVSVINDAPELAPYTGVSDENGLVHVELPMGMYTISDDSDEGHILLARAELGEEDLHLDLAYAVSTWVNGSMRTAPGGIDYSVWMNLTEEEREQQHDPVTALPVSARNGDLVFTTETDSQGLFALRLPVDAAYSLTATSILGVAHGSVVNVTAGMDALAPIYLQPAGLLRGTLYHIDNETTWDSQIPGWTPVDMTVTNGDGVVWSMESAADGSFSISLPDGLYDVEVVEAEDLNATSDESVRVSIDGFAENAPASLYLNPGGHAFVLRVFQDVSGDSNVSNGSMVTPAFAIVPTTVHGERVNVTSDMYDAEGNLTIVLGLGQYNIEFADDNAADPNASAYSLSASNTLQSISVGLPAPIESVDIALVDAWRVNGTLTDASGAALAPAGGSFLLVSADGEDYRSMSVDENGSFAAYVPSGEWIAVVAPYVVENVTETLRATVDVSDEVADLSLQTVIAGIIEVHLSEALSERDLEGFRLTLVSADGFGNVSMDLTNESGFASETIMPGDWSLHLERTDAQNRWTVDTTSTPVSVQSNSTSVENVSAFHEVEIGGRLFWDLDGDDVADAIEGVAEFNITVLGLDGSTFSENVTSDSEGVWQLFVPARTNYSVNGMRLGFADLEYTLDNTSYFPVNDSARSEDLEVSVGVVDVSGTITDSVDSSRLDGASVTLVPTAGLDREAIPILNPTFDGTTLSWNATVEPGSWLVVVQQATPGENDGAVAIDVLEASVADGGSIEQVMSKGGFVDLSTNWTDIELVHHHLGSEDAGASMFTDAPVVTVDLGDGREWDVSLNGDGTLELLLPSGPVSISGEVVTVQHELALNMSYSGSVSTSVAADRQEVTLTLERATNRDLRVEVGQVDESTVASVVDDANGVDIIAEQTDDGEHVQILMTLDVTYDGTEFEDVYKATGSAGNAPDASSWAIEFQDGANWTTSLEVRLGIGEDANDSDVAKSTTLQVRITLPSQANASSLTNGHTVSVTLRADSGEYTERAFTVKVPEVHAFTATAIDSDVGIGSDDSTTVQVTLTNEGNGDATFTYSLGTYNAEEWDITPTSSTITVAAGDSRVQTFTVRSGSEFASGDRLDLTVFVENEDGSVEEVMFTLHYAEIVIFVDEDGGDAVQASTNVAEQEVTILNIPVENRGERDASNVIVYLREQGVEADWQQVTVGVPAGETVNAAFDVGFMSPGNHRFEFYVEVTGDDAAYAQQAKIGSGDEPIDFPMTYNIESSEGAGQTLTGLIVLVIVALVIVGGFKIVRTGGRRF
jgi:asparagine N-glycosylation enzyme membrane subunit Stt3